MKQISLHKKWSYRRLGSEGPFVNIDLPYDCALHEKRSDDSPGGCNNAWFEGYDYEFIKEFAFEAGADEHVFLEFEGIYHRGEVWLNGEKVGYRPNGYLPIFADITQALRQGKNTLRVIARGADIPCSRWYTGAGIYRPVSLYVAGERYVLQDSVRITTQALAPALIEVRFKTHGSSVATVAILDGEQEVASAQTDCDGEGSVRFTLENAKLWSTGSPNLYCCRIRFETDVFETNFGVRTITCDAKSGFCVNGERILLRGACIHHDNGLLGAVSLPEAEERKVRLLQSCGYNAIRSAHNPCSKALLEACDRLGMLVMDEYADSWYIHKTKYDYATYLTQWYERDLRDMVGKDYNHPCVVLYSLGNEVTETAEERGVALFRKMRAALEAYDKTRPVTCGINIGFNQAAHAGYPFFSEEKAARNDFKNLGTENANHRKWMFGPLLTKLSAILPGCDRATRAIFGACGVAGYNYGILRYRHDRKKYPGRVILGSETFCEDAERFMKIAAKDNGIIGDFVWTGMDHLGEVGLGAWEYRDYAPTYLHTKGWLTSGAGRIDITGKLLPEAYYTKAAFGMLKEPYIAVRPVNHKGERHSPSGWKFTNAVSSWAWTGCEGKRATVEMYANGASAELWLNGKRIGRKSLKKSCRLIFKVPYKRGALTAIVYGKDGRELGRSTLCSEEEETQLCVEPEKKEAGQNELCYVRLRLADGNGTTKVLRRERIAVSVEGGELIALGHACPYNPEGYLNGETSTYFGEALAIVRTGTAGRMVINASCPSGKRRAEIFVRAAGRSPEY